MNHDQALVSLFDLIDRGLARDVELRVVFEVVVGRRHGGRLQKRGQCWDVGWKGASWGAVVDAKVKHVGSWCGMSAWERKTEAVCCTELHYSRCQSARPACKLPGEGPVHILALHGEEGDGLSLGLATWWPWRS